MDNFKVLDEKMELIMSELESFNKMFAKCLESYAKSVKINNDLKVKEDKNFLKVTLLTKHLHDTINNFMAFNFVINNNDFDSIVNKIIKTVGITREEFENDLLIGMATDVLQRLKI
jgi:hypothetical protein